MFIVSQFCEISKYFFQGGKREWERGKKKERK